MAWSSLYNTRRPKSSIHLPLSRKCWDYKLLSPHLDYNFYFLIQIKPLEFQVKQIFQINLRQLIRKLGRKISVKKTKTTEKYVKCYLPLHTQTMGNFPNLSCHSAKDAKTKPWFILFILSNFRSSSRDRGRECSEVFIPSCSYWRDKEQQYRAYYSQATKHTGDIILKQLASNFKFSVLNQLPDLV